jgi:hypothetical protein
VGKTWDWRTFEGDGAIDRTKPGATIVLSKSVLLVWNCEYLLNGLYRLSSR